MIDIESSWGRLRQVQHDVSRPAFLDEARAALCERGAAALCYGLGRSYGDVCTNENGRLIKTDWLDRFISFDVEQGILRAEAGITLDRLLQVTVPRGWFLPVTPGTKFVTLGGAVANDIHGKNHEIAGTFGSHVRAIGLVRSSGEILDTSRDQNSELFAATIGGLGLTGLISWAEIQLIPIRASFVDTEVVSIKNLADFFRRMEDNRNWPYTVAWVDCLARGQALGRGLLIRGRHAETQVLTSRRQTSIRLPFEAPGWIVNAATLAAFNAAYRYRPWASGRHTVHYNQFFFPLDSVVNWNRLYGRRGFYQHQSAIPMASAYDTIQKLLSLTAESGQGSFLVVLKLFGNRPSPGLLSFPMPGATLALDFPNKGESTLRLLERMTEAVLAVGGRLYPAKDAIMSPSVFKMGYPAWRKLEALRDPAIESDFWRRVVTEAK